MTPDSLKQARAKEAVRRSHKMFGATYFFEDIALEALTLAETDWRPPEPINPDLIEARECCALVAEAMGAHGLAVEYRGGGYDDRFIIQSILLAIKRTKGREVGS